MKHLLLAPTLLFAAVPAVFSETVVDSAIREVTVYSDRAIVMRNARVVLREGLNELRFDVLPANLLDDSLQVRAIGTSAATILDVRLRESFVAATPEPHRKSLEDRLMKLREDERRLDDQAAILGSQRDLVLYWQTSAVSLGSEEKTGRPSLDDMQAALRYGGEELAKITASLQQIARERSALDLELGAVQSELDELPAASARRSVKSALVRVQAAQAGDLDLDLSYTTGEAGWRPSYEARVLSAEGRVELGYFAQIRQSTGEDWNEVGLTLSTARPSLGGHAPEVGTWALDLRSEEEVGVYPGVRVQALSASAPAEKNARRMTFDLVSADYAQASVSPSTIATFKIDSQTTILSDYSEQKIPITALNLEAELAYRTTPKLRKIAFLDARATNNSDYPLLGGQMSVFVDNNFIATSGLQTTMPSETFSLALGADEGISIMHKQVRKFTEQVGLMSKSTRVSYDYLITIQNNKTGAARVVLTDHVPVSRNEKITVKVQAPSAKEAKPDAEGKIEWALDLGPSESRELRIKFTVEYPVDLRVSGLE